MKAMFLRAVLLSAVLSFGLAAQQPPPASPPPSVTNAVAVVVVPPPPVQVTLGTLEAVRGMEANLQIARHASRDAEKAWKASPSDPTLQANMAAAKIAQGTAEENLRRARSALSDVKSAEREIRAAARRRW